MLRYMVYGLIVYSDSPLPLPQLEGSINERMHQCVNLFLRHEAPQSPPPERWFATYSLPGHTPWLREAKVADGYLLRFWKHTDFWVAQNGNLVTCAKATAEASMDAVCHLAVDQVLPYVVNLLGRIALHATSIVTPEGICAFVGVTGAGKSTLAASFAANDACPVFCDDCLVIEEDHNGSIMAVPGNQNIRLWSDSAKELFGATLVNEHRKTHIKQSPTLRFGKMPLIAIFDLIRGNAGSQLKTSNEVIRVEKLSEREALIRLLRSSYRLDTTDRPMLLREFNGISRLVKAVAMRRLFTGSGFDGLPVLRRKVLDELKLL